MSESFCRRLLPIAYGLWNMCDYSGPRNIRMFRTLNIRMLILMSIKCIMRNNNNLNDEKVHFVFTLKNVHLAISLGNITSKSEFIRHLFESHIESPIIKI